MFHKEEADTEGDVALTINCPFIVAVGLLVPHCPMYVLNETPLVSFMLMNTWVTDPITALLNLKLPFVPTPAT